MRKVLIPFWLFIILWLAAFLLPFCLLRAVPLAAVMLGIGIPILWLWQMPTTCMSGGLIAPLMGMVQLALLLFWVGIGLLRLLKS